MNKSFITWNMEITYIDDDGDHTTMPFELCQVCNGEDDSAGRNCAHEKKLEGKLLYRTCERHYTNKKQDYIIVPMQPEIGEGYEFYVSEILCC